MIFFAVHIHSATEKLERKYMQAARASEREYK
jgi:hypothetical protein